MQKKIDSLEKSIQNHLRNGNYGEVIPLLDKFKNNENYIFYTYFLYEATNEKEKKLKVLDDIFQKFDNDKSKAYLEILNKVKPVSQNIRCFFDTSYIENLLLIALEENDENAELQFRFGTHILDNNNDINGLKYINNAIKLDHKFDERKLNFLHSIYPSYIYFSQSDLELLFKECYKCYKDDEELWYKVFDFALVLEKYEIIEELIVDFEKSEKSNFYLVIRIVEYYCYQNDEEKIKNYYLKLADSNVTLSSKCIEKYCPADIALEILESGKYIQLDKNLLIANTYYRLGNYKKSLFLIDTILENPIDAYSTEKYKVMYFIKSYLLKSKIELELKNEKKALKVIQLAYSICKLEFDIDLISDEKIGLYFPKEVYLEVVYFYAKLCVELYIENIFFYEEKLSMLILLLKQHKFNEEKVSELQEKRNDIIKKNNEQNAKHIIDVKGKSVVGKIEGDSSSYSSIDLAEAYRSLKKYDDAISIYENLLESDPEHASYLNNLAICYSDMENSEKASELIEKAKKYGEFSSGKNTILKNYNDLKSGGKQNVELEFNLFKEEFKVAGNDDFKPKIDFYKYKSFNNFTLDSIANDYMYFSCSKELNDPQDLTFHNDNEEEVKILSLSKERCHPLMWAHYADSHKGICIKYKINLSLHEMGHSAVKYIKPGINEKDLDLTVMEYGMFCKHESWEYEKEYRLASYKGKSKIKYKYPIDLNEKQEYIQAYISEIIFGLKFDESMYNVLRPILLEKNRLRSKFIGDIKVSKVYEVPEKSFTLETREISNFYD